MGGVVRRHGGAVHSHLLEGIQHARVPDALVAHGGPDTIAVKVRAHLAAGADHVTLLLPVGTEFAPGIHQLTLVAPVLADFT